VVKIHELDKLLVIDKTNNLRRQSMCKKYAVFAPTCFGGWLLSAASSACSMCDIKRNKDSLDPTCM